MATVSVDVGGSAVNLATGLTVGTRYIAELVPTNDGPFEVRIVEQADAPSTPEAWHTLRRGDRIGIQPRTGEGIWAWTPDGVAGKLAVSES